MGIDYDPTDGSNQLCLELWCMTSLFFDALCESWEQSVWDSFSRQNSKDGTMIQESPLRKRCIAWTNEVAERRQKNSKTLHIVAPAQSCFFFASYKNIQKLLIFSHMFSLYSHVHDLFTIELICCLSLGLLLVAMERLHLVALWLQSKWLPAVQCGSIVNQCPALDVPSHHRSRGFFQDPGTCSRQRCLQRGENATMRSVRICRSPGAKWNLMKLVCQILDCDKSQTFRTLLFPEVSCLYLSLLWQ